MTPAGMPLRDAASGANDNLWLLVTCAGGHIGWVEVSFRPDRTLLLRNVLLQYLR
jgi:predicted alpha/beta-fold hydrolase